MPKLMSKLTIMGLLILGVAATAQQQTGQREPAGPATGGPTIRIRTPLRWWKESRLVQAIAASQQQVDEIEQIFEQRQPQLSEMVSTLEAQERQLTELLDSAQQPDAAQVDAKIDQVAQSRANLEKSNAQMLLAIRRVLSADQWKKLQEETSQMLQRRAQEKRRDFEEHRREEPPRPPEEPLD